MEPEPTVRRRMGRPLSFDREAALEIAMLLFWERGYEATSIADLTAALGVTPPSIYTAFGDKKRLFLEAMRRYVESGEAPEQVIECAETARSAAWSLLEAAAIGFTGTATPSGCLLATAAITGSPEAADVRAELAAVRRRIEASLRARIERGKVEGERLPDSDAETLARLVIATIQGLSTLARDGASREKLLRIASASLRCWGDADR